MINFFNDFFSDFDEKKLIFLLFIFALFFLFFTLFFF